MKTKILLLSILLIAQLANCQYFKENSSWTQIKTPGYVDTSTVIYNYKVSGDTIIGSNQYLKLFRNDSYFLPLRESEDGIVYMYQTGLEMEFVVYDFDWSEGKTLEFQPIDELGDSVPYVTISTIDSVKLLDNKYYKCLKNNDRIFCIQGLGDLAGFFRHMFAIIPDGSKTPLLCFFHGNQLIYSNPDYKDCTLFPTMVESRDINQQIRVFPQPSNGNVTFAFPDNLLRTFEEIKIYGENGQLICTEIIRNRNQVELVGLEVGAYFYSISNRENQTIYGNFVITR